MSRPLHHTDVFADLANGQPGVARDWARVRLALFAPERLAALPSGNDLFDVVMLALGERWVDALEGSLKEGPLSPGVASTIGAASSYGLLPASTERLVTLLRSSFKGGASDGSLWISLLLAQLGEADGAALSAAASSGNPDTRWVLPIIVLHVADAAGQLDAAAAEVARGLTPLINQDPNLLFALAGVAGLPFIGSALHLRDPAEAAREGAAAAGGELQEIQPGPGSKKRRTQRWVAALLDGVPGPRAALIRALYAHDPGANWGVWPVASAAWLRCFTATNPVDDVLTRAAGADPRTLAEAVRTGATAEQIEAALERDGDPAAAVLAVPHLRDGNADLAEAVLEALARVGPQNHRMLALGSIAAAFNPAVVAKLLSERESRDLGLLIADLCPDETVLEALLALPVPADPDARQLYAHALASMADPAALPVLLAMAEEDEEDVLGEARSLSEALLGPWP